MANTSDGEATAGSWRGTIRPAFLVDWSGAEPLAALRCTVGVGAPLIAALAWLGPPAATFVAVGAVATGFGSFQAPYPRSRACGWPVIVARSLAS